MINLDYVFAVIQHIFLTSRINTFIKIHFVLIRGDYVITKSKKSEKFNTSVQSLEIVGLYRDNGLAPIFSGF